MENLNRRDLTSSESACCDRCTAKSVVLNHRVLGAFMVEQPLIQQRKAEEAHKEMEKLARKGIEAENVAPEEMAKRMMSGMPAAAVPNPTPEEK